MFENIFMRVGGGDEKDVLKQDLKDQTRRGTSGFGCSKIKDFHSRRDCIGKVNGEKEISEKEGGDYM